MAMLDKVQFWKRKDEELDLSTGLTPEPLSMPPPLHEEKPFTPPAPNRSPDFSGPSFTEMERSFATPQQQGFGSPQPMQEFGSSLPSPDRMLHDDIQVRPLNPQPMPGQRPGGPPQQSELAKDIQLILARMDTLKAILDNILIRIDKLEKQHEGKDVRW